MTDIFFSSYRSLNVLSFHQLYRVVHHLKIDKSFRNARSQAKDHACLSHAVHLSRCEYDREVEARCLGIIIFMVFRMNCAQSDAVLNSLSSQSVPVRHGFSSKSAYKCWADRYRWPFSRNDRYRWVPIDRYRYKH